MKKIVVPEGMLKAALENFDRRTHAAHPDTKSITCALEAALLWLSEHPQVPTDEQAKQLRSLLVDSLQYWFTGSIELKKEAAESIHGRIDEIMSEWQRRCFVQEEPEISATAKTIGQRMMGITFNAADADYLINKVILGSTPDYVPALRKGEQK